MDDLRTAAANVPPHSVEAEQSVLGALLLHNAAYDRAAELLTTQAFYRSEHRLIWAAIERLVLADKPADVITVFEQLRAAGQAQDAGGLQYLNELVQSVAGSANVAAYAGVVALRARGRRAMAVAQALLEQARAGAGEQASLDRAIDAAMLELLALQQGGSGDEPRLLNDLLPAWIDALNDRAAGKTDAIPTGLRDVDRLLGGGARRGEVMVIGARPSMGKSAMMLTISRNMAKLGPVLVCSLEDSEMMLVSRQVAAAGRVNLADIRSPEHAPDSMWVGVADGVDALRPLLLYIDDRPALKLADVRRKAMQVRRRHGDLLMVVVDYMQLMEGDGETRAHELNTVARGLKRLAKDLRCVVLLLSQINREADKLEGPPRLDHLAESGGIEQAGDVIGLLWREVRRRPRPDNKHAAQVEFAKNKNGATGTVHLYFDGATQRFEDAIGDAAYA